MATAMAMAMAQQRKQHNQSTLGHKVPHRGRSHAYSVVYNKCLVMVVGSVWRASARWRRGDRYNWDGGVASGAGPDRPVMTLCGVKAA